MDNQKRVITVQDISCIGKCSATVALPILSAMGAECALLPTAVLSTHTGGFSGFTFLDLTEELDKIVEHWKKESFKFDGIYSGYLASPAQVKQVENLIDDFGPHGAVAVIDPVMADHGKLYTGFTQEHVEAMAGLCGKADIVLPNLTEATLMLGMEYTPDGYGQDYVDAILEGLAALGAKVPVLTGVNYGDGRLGIMGIDTRSGEKFSYFHEKIDQSFHGTGDIFASAFTGALMRGESLESCCKTAADFTVECIKNTMDTPKDRWYGVRFENCMGLLCK
ncbi:MAG: pyridoxamine kinase [Oscillospiraceae bacterium]|nr:pyridoxamine kinase [Oscillospiraceae bacterium]